MLLAHGHGCEDFEGMCCMDLQDNSSAIHSQIQQLMDHSKKIKQDTGLFGLEGLTNMLNLGGWIGSLLQSLIMLLIIVMVVLLYLSCIFSCIKKLLCKQLNGLCSYKNKKGELLGIG